MEKKIELGISMEKKVKEILQLHEGTFDAGVKEIAELACKAFCRKECSHPMANKCNNKDFCTALGYFKICFAEGLEDIKI